MAKKKKGSIGRRSYQATRTFLRLFRGEKAPEVLKAPRKFRVAFIHNEKKLQTGASQINDLISKALSKEGVDVQHIFPKQKLFETPSHLKGIANILFFYSLLEYKDKVLAADIVQGTTYTPLPFTPFQTPTVCHFGSTSRGFLNSTPWTLDLPQAQKAVFKHLFRLGIIPELDFKTLRPIQDVADVEELTALKASACIATSKKVKKELMEAGVPEANIHVIHNAIEDYWFNHGRRTSEVIAEPHLVFLGRLGGDIYTLKLKGFSRLVNIYKAFPEMPKTTVCMTTSRKLKEWLKVSFPKHHMFVNMRKDFIPGALAPLRGSILIVSSRYEGFSLSLVEGMSQGLIPVTFPVGVAPEIIRDGENGFLVGSEKAAIEKIRLLRFDPVLRERMAEAAEKTAEQFKSENIARELLRTYKHIRAEKK